MHQVLTIARGVRLVAVIGAALLLGACRKTTSGGSEGGASLSINGAAPGTSQDFVVNVGDRVFFETDSTQLTTTAIATLNKQAVWLQHYPRYVFTVEGHADERGTREY